MSSHVTRFPRPSPAVFHTRSDQMLAVGTAWERPGNEAKPAYKIYPNAIQKQRTKIQVVHNPLHMVEDVCASYLLGVGV